MIGRYKVLLAGMGSPQKSVLTSQLLRSIKKHLGVGECEEVLAAQRPRDLLHTCQRRLHERLAGLGQLVSLARHVAGGHCVILLPGVVAAG